MRCIHCGTDSRLKDRKDRRCPKCRHPFAFEPTSDPNRVTDGQLKHAVDRVSELGTVLFTERQLWYEFNRRWMKPLFRHNVFSHLGYAAAGAGPGFILAQFLASTATLALAGMGALAGLGLGVYRGYRGNRREPPLPRPPRIPFAQFQKEYLARWIAVHGPVPGLLPRREAALRAVPGEVPPDVAAFSFDRAVVTDTWDTAAMLVANRFHFEHNCAVLSRGGYPDGIADTVKTMLRRNPRLTVFALHDASPGGCDLPLALRQPEWFPDPGVRIVDLGLRPETVRRLRIPALPGAPVQLPPRLAEILSAEDLAWLARGHTAELAALHPAQVLRAAYHGIVAAGPNDGSGDGACGGDAYCDGGIIWIGDLRPGADTAAVDGFG